VTQDELIRRWQMAHEAAKRPAEPHYGCAKPLDVDEDQLKREAEAGRELMKEMT